MLKDGSKKARPPFMYKAAHDGKSALVIRSERPQLGAPFALGHNSGRWLYELLVVAKVVAGGRLSGGGACAIRISRRTSGPGPGYVEGSLGSCHWFASDE